MKLKEELEKVWGVKTAVEPVVTGAAEAVTPSENWFQQIPQIRSHHLIHIASFF